MLSYQKPNLNEVFLWEFVEDYTASISNFEPFGIHPQLTDKILTQLKLLSSLNLFAENKATLVKETERIEKQQSNLHCVLEGKEFAENRERKSFFPLIIKDSPDGFYGMLESVSVHLSKNSDTDKFIIVPSEKEIEKKIIDQCRTSWYAALDLSKQYVSKPHHYHEVIISFDKKDGFYEGNSLGIVLTLAFLEHLLKFYNPTYLIKIKEFTAFTGGITRTQKILPTGKEIIKQKVKVVFFSEIVTFVIPKNDEIPARDQLLELQKEYPQRNLKLIPVEDIDDVLNRRDVVDIRKQKLVVRTGKFVKKNWVSAVITVLLALLFGYLFVVDWDDNPATFSVDGQIVFIKNKNGKVLWTKNCPMGLNLIEVRDLYPFLIKIVDTNYDGLNEVLLIGEKSNNPGLVTEPTTLKCYDTYGNGIWKYTFHDQVFSQRETLDTEYGIKILDTLNFDGRKSLYLISTNLLSFGSAVFSIDLSNGERLPGIFWCSGHIVSGIMRDINNDGKKDILCLGSDNGFEDAVLFGLEIDTLSKVRSTTEKYLIRDYPLANLITYIRFPKVDYDIFFENRMPSLNPGILIFSEQNRKYYFYTDSPDSGKYAKIGYEISEDFKDINIGIEGNFRVRRDSLVAHGKLNLPYTDTEEYRDLIKSKILYWKDGKWVKRKELD